MPTAENLTRMLDLIVCPACRSSLTLTKKAPFLLCCTSCGRCYSIKDGIPVLIAERATT